MIFAIDCGDFARLFLVWCGSLRFQNLKPAPLDSHKNKNREKAAGTSKPSGQLWCGAFFIEPCRIV